GHSSVTEWDALPIEPVATPLPQQRVEHAIGRVATTHPLLLALAVGIGAWLLASLSSWLSRFPGQLAAIWFTNAFGVIVLLAVPMGSWRWTRLLTAHAAGVLAANLAFGDSVFKALAFLPPNLVEVVLGAGLLARTQAHRQLADSPAGCLRSLMLGSALPALAGSVSALPLLGAGEPDAAMRLWLSWFEGSLMGSVSLLPLGLALLHSDGTRLREAFVDFELWMLALLSVGLAVFALLQLPFPFGYIALPLMLAAVRLRFVAVAALVWLVATVADTLIVQGLFAPPPQTAYWQQVYVYAPLLAALLPPLMLAAATEQVRARRSELMRSRERQRALYERTPAMMLTTDAAGRIVAVSQHWLQRTGHERADVIGRLATDFMVEESRQRAQNQIGPLVASAGHCLDVEYRLLRRDGEVLDVLWSATTETDLDGQLTRVHAVMEDVTRKRLAEALAAEHVRSRVTLESIADAVISSDARGRITYLNPVALMLIGEPPGDLIGRRYGEVLRRHDVDSGVELRDPVAQCLLRRSSPDLPSRVRLQDRRGSDRVVRESVAPMLDADGELIGVVAVMQDVSEAHALALQLAHRAQHDELTGLPNRLLLHDRLKLALSMARRSPCVLALLFIDLDRFKAVNDAHGHAVGDELLREVANRLLQNLRSSDTAARIGGDEFVVLLPRIEHVGDAARVATHLIEVLSRPYKLSLCTADVGASIGIACHPQDGDDEAMLMRHADTAMYRAKQLGRSQAQFFKAPD
ncbi:MAG: diguanylate cyclase, partial [Leptothrix sp. (in: b-proteobacteria)]